MDNNKLIELFKGTIDPNLRADAEKHLEQVHKIIGFVPSILQVVMDSNVEMPVRQASAIYMKNQVVTNWADKPTPPPGQPTGQMVYSIHEQDRGVIREQIVEAIVLAPDLLRVHLATCVNHMIKHDFPGRWVTIVEKIAISLQTPEPNRWMGALVALYQLVKNFEYKNNEDRTPLLEAMKLLAPVVYQLFVNLMPDPSEQSVLLQKQMLKIFYALVQYSLPLSLLTNEIFTQWMEIFRQIVDRDVPQDLSNIDIDERPELAWFKAKKWAVRIMTRVFERYGSPGNVHKEYKAFADWYIKTFSHGIIQVMLKILEQYGHKVYVPPRVMQQSLNYLNTAVNHAFTWKLIKAHMTIIVQNILFPLMCYSDEDEELWSTDPQEYIRIKFDVFEDYVSPIVAAQTLLHTCCKKRKEMLQKSMGFAVQVLSNTNSDPRMKDGALYMVGAVADILLKKDLYKDQMENMIVAYVFPQFQSPHGYLRARACWTLHYFHEIQFTNDANLYQALSYLQNCLLTDKDLPVKVQAAISMQEMISFQDKSKQMIEPNITQIALELLKVIRDTESEEMTNVIQKVVCIFSEQLTPICVQMTEHLAHTLSHVINPSADDDGEDKALTAMGILNTIDSILIMMEEQKDIMEKLEPIVIQIIVSIFNQELMELYEEAFSLIATITTNTISLNMWKIFEMMYQIFNKDGFDYFTDMMPSLHNFITVDPDAFIGNSNNILAIFEMSKSIMNSESGEEAECHAAKLLECIILQFKGRIDTCIPSFVELAITRMTRNIEAEDLRTICLQVVIAALFYNSDLTFQILEKLQMPNSNQSLINHFINKWIADTHCFVGLHDRKMCVLGLCTLMSLEVNKRPQALNDLANQLMPSLLLLFDGLKEAYKSKAENEYESDTDSDAVTDDDEEGDDVEDLDDDEDNVRAHVMDDDRDESDIDDDDDEDDDDDFELTALESYKTSIDSDDTPDDEYIIFKELLESIQQKDPNWYSILMSPLNGNQQKSIQEIYTLALQRKAAAESRKIEKSGGYMFANANVPTSFNFGGTPLS
ncbi:importin-7-like isoform X2 [Oppia nitens]|uniref:importin-7-like isoform X2 n=1 Tax=Oppia nitens TaxID=1686743 RepID=UPI0023DA6D30|nr:importin-7-like isoform X2 [Oppia nitens]